MSSSHFPSSAAGWGPPTGTGAPAGSVPESTSVSAGFPSVTASASSSPAAGAFGSSEPATSAFGSSSTSADGFGSQPGAGFGATATTPTTAPVALLYGSIAASVVGIGVALLLPTLVGGAIGWVLAALVGLGLSTFFTVRNAQRQANPWYLYYGWHTVVYRASVVVALVAVVVAAGRLALVLGRM